MHSLRLLSATAAWILLAGACSAQPGTMIMPRAPKFPMFMDPAVRKELALTEEQEKKVKEVLEEFQQGAQQEGGKFVIRIGGPGGGGAPELPDFKKIEDDLMKVLDEKQKKRFKEIWLQRQGLTALADADVAKEVGLQDDQRELVKDIMDSHQQDMHKMIQEAAADSCGGPIRIDDKKAKELREKTEKHLSELLTKAQEEKWKAMLGPKFEKKKG